LLTDDSKIHNPPEPCPVSEELEGIDRRGYAKEHDKDDGSRE
jgi:hypothetical protein